MKKIKSSISVILSALMTIFIQSCIEAGHPATGMIASLHPHLLTLSTNSISFSKPTAQSTNIKVTSDNTPWQFENIPDWVTVSKKSGDGNATVAVSVSGNEVATNRLGLITFKSTDDEWNYSTTLSVSQVRCAYHAVPETDSFLFDGGAGSKTLTVSSNTDAWNAVADASLSKWCSVAKGDSKITLTYSANTGSTSRTGKVEVTTSESTEYITVTQRPANISVTVETLHFENAGHSLSLSIQTEAEWTAQTSYSWLDISPASGPAGISTVVVRALSNNSLSDRNGYIYIQISDDNRIEIPVMQDGIKFSVNKKDFSYPVSGGDRQFEVTSNTSWYFEDGIPEWVSVNPKSGEGNGIASIRLKENPGADARTASVLIRPKELDNPVSLAIYQEGHTLGSDSTSLHFAIKGGSSTFRIESDGQWTIDTEQDWIHVSPMSGNGNATVTVTVDDNSAGLSRSGIVSVSIEGKTLSLAVHQSGKYMTVSSEALDFSSKGGSTVVSLNTNVDWTAQAGSDWITLSSLQGSGGCSLTIKASDSHSAQERSSWVDIKPANMNVIRVSVTQAARYLRTSADTLTFFRRGGTSDAVLIETDGVCEITNTAAWITVNRLSATQFTVTAQDYTDGTEERQATLSLSLTDVVTGSVTKNVTVVQKGRVDMQYVDLGLSVRWATCNIGATKPEEYGDYFAWGATEPWYQPGYAQSGSPVWKSGKSDGYTWKNALYQTVNTTDHLSTRWTKYLGSTTSSNKDASATNADAMKTVLDLEDDAAYVNWGGNWRMPTTAEIQELQNSDNCTWTWATMNGVYGYKIVSRKSGYEGNYIFLPAGGYRNGTRLSSVGSYGGYWSGSLDTSYPYGAYNLYFYSNYVKCFGYYRSYGQSVRPVCPVPVTGISLSRQSFELMEGGAETLTATVQYENGTTGNTATWSSSNTGVATVDQTGKVTAISAGTCIITATSGSCYATCSVTVKPFELEYVDLGLSVNWATFNVGAKKPEDYGDYFAWGETSPKSDYSWSTYKYSKGSSLTMTKYCDNSIYGYNGYTDNKTVLDLADDAAHVNWGGDWRLPTRAEQDELRNTSNCTWTWTTMNGVNGYKVVSKKSGYAGNWIFLPAAGYRYDATLFNVGSYGYYWSSSLDTSPSSGAYHLYFSSGYVGWDNYSRDGGQSVRPVCPVPVTGISLNEQSVEIMEGGTETLTATVMYENGATGNTATWTSSNTGVATVDQSGKITAVSVGTCTITATSGSCSATCSVTVKANVHQYVDLGLSVKWATCNVGATKPEEYGDYFAWGETDTKSDYSWSSYKFCYGSANTLSKYCSMSNYGYNGYTDANVTLTSGDDAAQVNWGSDWRMPTGAEFKELQDNCSMTTISVNNVQGIKCQSNIEGYTDKWIFFPFAGYYDGTEYLSVATAGTYWSSSLNVESPELAPTFSLFSWWKTTSAYYRYLGQSVRPVYGGEIRVAVSSITLSEQNLTLYEGQKQSLIATVQPANAYDKSVYWQSSNKDVATVKQNGEITAKSEGTCTIRAVSSDADIYAECYVVVYHTDENNTEQDDHEYVDLGLSVKWATCNIGAAYPEDYGDYFAWGETEPYYSSLFPLVWKNGKGSGFSWDSYNYCQGSIFSMTKYCSNSAYGYNGFSDNKTVLDPEDDAAHVNWGGSWRMPTYSELDELKDLTNCSWTWTTLNGVSGYKVVSKKSGYVGNYIFLPAAGERQTSNLSGGGTQGRYWSNNLYIESPAYSNALNFNSYETYWWNDDRYFGFSIRPVYPK